MGTSKNRNKLRPSIPLIPSWIDATPLPVESTPDNENEQSGEDDIELPENDTPANRFIQVQKEFSRGVRADNINRGLFTRVLKNYVQHSGGGARTLAQRMRRSSSSLIQFNEVLSEIRTAGLQNVLARLNLQQYVGRGAIEILAALMDFVCGTGAILDDAITKVAYANTIVKIDEQIPNVDLDSLTQDQVYEMMAIFLQETIVYRLLSDIGRSLTVGTSDFEKALEIEEEIYQIVDGLVNSTVLPLLESAISSSLLRERMDNIYETTFRTIITSRND